MNRPPVNGCLRILLSLFTFNVASACDPPTMSTSPSEGSSRAPAPAPDSRAPGPAAGIWWTPASDSDRVFAVLSVASRQMHQAYQQLGRYPSTWRELMGPTGFQAYTNNFSIRPIASDWPTVGDGALWVPKRLFHALHIVRADDQRFLIEAVDTHGRTTWSVSEADKYPVRLLPMLCHVEARFMWGSTNEAFAFLTYAGLRLQLERWAFESWEQTRLHWSMQDHLEKDPNTKPPPGSGAAWRPQGSKFTYHLKAEGNYYVLWSSNDRGLTNYILDGLEADPVEYKP